MIVREKIHLGIGEYYASEKPVTIFTNLGSCVAVCLFDNRSKIGGMNHILLPGGPADMNCFNDAARFGINAMELLINRILYLGGRKENLSAKIFGGAHLFPDISPNSFPGRKNVEFVKNFLDKEKIKIVSQHTGGIFSRIIYFHSETAAVFLKTQKSSFFDEFNKEKEYLDKYRTEIIRPDITMF